MIKSVTVSRINYNSFKNKRIHTKLANRPAIFNTIYKWPFVRFKNLQQNSLFIYRVKIRNNKCLFYT